MDNADLTPTNSAAQPEPLVLLVEDDQPLRESLQMVLEAFGFHVAAAENGRAGLEAVATEHPAVIVTDLHMPELDGFELMTALRKAGSDIPIIAISGGSSTRTNSLLHCAKTFGAAAVFEKPFSPLELIDAITALPAFAAPRLAAAH